jgi:motility quorum-sensing regulator / GCU-specific mRNA interferase toxin
MLPLAGLMGRGEPTYDLHELQRLIGQGAISSSVTRVAEEGAVGFGWSRDDIVEAVLALTAQDFYKSMESERMPGSWQDVYHLEFRGVSLYIKLQLGVGGRAFVVQFKRR